MEYKFQINFINPKVHYTSELHKKIIKALVKLSNEPTGYQVLEHWTFPSGGGVKIKGVDIMLYYEIEAENKISGESDAYDIRDKTREEFIEILNIGLNQSFVEKI